MCPPASLLCCVALSPFPWHRQRGKDPPGRDCRTVRDIKRAKDVATSSRRELIDPVRQIDEAATTPTISGMCTVTHLDEHGRWKAVLIAMACRVGEELQCRISRP